MLSSLWRFAVRDMVHTYVWDLIFPCNTWSGAFLTSHAAQMMSDILLLKEVLYAYCMVPMKMRLLRIESICQIRHSINFMH